MAKTTAHSLAINAEKLANMTDRIRKFTKRPKLDEDSCEELCDKCNGSGKIHGTDNISTCKKCNGEGKLNWIEKIVGKEKSDEEDITSNIAQVFAGGGGGGGGGIAHGGYGAGGSGYAGVTHYHSIANVATSGHTSVMPIPVVSNGEGIVIKDLGGQHEVSIDPKYIEGIKDKFKEQILKDMDKIIANKLQMELIKMGVKKLDDN